jgi:hypothetical protein
MISTTFSGSFKTMQTGKPEKNISYNGSIGSENGKMSIDIETDVDGVVNKLARKGITMQDLRTDPEVLTFMAKLKDTAKAKKRKKNKKTKRAAP